MQARLAKKIVLRVQAGLANHLSYPRTQVEDAFRVMGLTPTSKDLLPWDTQAVTKKFREDPAALAARQEANRVQREQTLARLEIRRKDRVARRKAAQEQAERQKTVGIIADHVQGGVSASDIAVAAGRAAFEQTMQTGTVPTSIEITPDPTPAHDMIDQTLSALKEALATKSVAEVAQDMGMTLEDMSVDALKDWCKLKGLKGYSAKKKADLVALLTGA
jgi:hypothetical protein